jgi:hypothetical protein
MRFQHTSGPAIHCQSVAIQDIDQIPTCPLVLLIKGIDCTRRPKTVAPNLASHSGVRSAPQAGGEPMPTAPSAAVAIELGGTLTAGQLRWQRRVLPRTAKCGESSGRLCRYVMLGRLVVFGQGSSSTTITYVGLGDFGERVSRCEAARTARIYEHRQQKQCTGAGDPAPDRRSSCR